jgi:hypothetical protein
MKFYGTLEIPFRHKPVETYPELLSLGRGNAKIDEYISTFSLPAGYTCPGANQCLSRVCRATGKIADGPATVFRCFSASQESLYPVVRKSRWGNFLRLKACRRKRDMARVILKSLPQSKFLPAVRIHVSGDFFSQMYFDAWMDVARKRPNVIFYAYTKSIPFWVKRKRNIPRNVNLTASLGSKYDDLIKRHKLKTCQVVFTVQEATKLRLPIDHNDEHAYESRKPFCVLLHGKQGAGTASAAALLKLKHAGINGYGVQKEKRVQVVA